MKLKILNLFIYLSLSSLQLGLFFSCSTLASNDFSNIDESFNQGSNPLMESPFYSFPDSYEGIAENQNIPDYLDVTLERPNRLFESSRYLTNEETLSHEEMLFNSSIFQNFIKGSTLSEQMPYMIENLERVIYFNKNFVKISEKINFSGLENAFKQNAPFVFLFPVHEAVQMFGLKVKNLNSSEIYKPTVLKDYQISDFDLVKKNPLPAIQAISLGEPVIDDGKTWISLEYYLGRPYSPQPEDQYIDNSQTLEIPIYSLTLTPYQIVSQTTLIMLGHDSKLIELAHSKLPEETIIKSDKNYIKLGPFLHTPSYNLGFPLKVTIESNTALPVFSQASKTLRLSPWKKIQINEKYNLLNEAARLKGPFKRKDVIYKTHQFRGMLINPPPSTVLSKLDAHFPASLQTFDYFDVNGNISTSFTYENTRTNEIKIEVVPRYPVLGNWKAYFEFAYQLPLSEYLQSRLYKAYTISIPLSPSITKVYTESYKIEIKFPYGTSNIRYTSPITPCNEKLTSYWDWLQLAFPSPKLELEFHKFMTPTQSDFYKYQLMVEYNSNQILYILSIIVSVVTLFLIPLIFILYFSSKSARIIRKDGLKMLKKQNELDFFKNKFLMCLEDIMLSYGRLISFLRSKESSTFISEYWKKEKQKFLDTTDKLLQTFSEKPPQLIDLKAELSEVLEVLFQLAPKEVAEQVSNDRSSNKNSNKDLESCALNTKFLALDQKISALFISKSLI